MAASTSSSGGLLVRRASSLPPGTWSARSGRSGASLATNPDFRDLLSELSDEVAEFIVVGAHAVMFHSAPRYTKDLDIWVRPSPEIAGRVFRALAKFGAPLSDLSPDDLATPGTIFQIGVAPNRIDVTTSIEAITIDEAWPRRVPTTYGSVGIAVLSIDDLIVNKSAVGRPQDLLDVAALERVRRPSARPPPLTRAEVRGPSRRPRCRRRPPPTRPSRGRGSVRGNREAGAPSRPPRARSAASTPNSRDR